VSGRAFTRARVFVAWPLAEAWPADATPNAAQIAPRAMSARIVALVGGGCTLGAR
jgi:hypothetical protein